MTYEEKQQAKLERFKELASKNKMASESAYKASNALSDAIPFGQPILVGHHSEKGHRRAIERIHSSMNKSIELAGKSEYYENKVANILNPTSISSDDENAVSKLKEKLVVLEKEREKFKEFNKNARKTHTDALPSWKLSNLSQNIASVKKRITHLESLSKIEYSEEMIGDVNLKINKEENRVQLFFPGKPSEEVRTKLKSNGFHWSPLNACWQRQISNWAITLAREIISKKEVENGTTISTEV